MTNDSNPIFQAGFKLGLETAIAVLEGRASMAIETRKVIQGEALELAARQVRGLLTIETQEEAAHG